MNFNSLLLILVFGLFSLTTYANAFTQDTIATARSKADKAHVILTANVIRALDRDEFIIKDATGEIEIEIDFSTDREEYAFFQQYPNLVGAQIVIEGFLDKEFMDRTKIDVTRVEVISASGHDPFSEVVNKARSVNK